MAETSNEAAAETPCKHVNTEMGFGLAGGGYGAYQYCEDCGFILEKWQEEDENLPTSSTPVSP